MGLLLNSFDFVHYMLNIFFSSVVTIDTHNVPAWTGIPQDIFTEQDMICKTSLFRKQYITNLKTIYNLP